MIMDEGAYQTVSSSCMIPAGEVVSFWANWIMEMEEALVADRILSLKQGWGYDHLHDPDVPEIPPRKNNVVYKNWLDQCKRNYLSAYIDWKASQ